ncbi:MAG TPA: SAM-dependent chlorinase/fluorinase [Kofleriaceae bacterium]|nr:SAM-dependent chlorinase/fluorinase [Kofleriaceae bacterium]
MREPLVTLMSDFGTADGYVGAMKGVVLTLAPSARLVDLTHAIPRHDIPAGAFALAQAAPHFPEGTIHLAVVDPGVGGQRACVIVDAGGQLFIGPDNGLFSLVAPTPRAAWSITDDRFLGPARSATFHGRDVFAVAAGRIAAGAAPSEAGPPIELLGCLTLARAAARPDDGLVATVLHVDGFGNLITDLGADELPGEPRFQVGDRIIEHLSTTFESVARGELVAYIGSGSTLEIAIREGDAAAALGVGRGAAVAVLEHS